MAGHGTIVNVSEAQGDCKVYISSAGEKGKYPTGSTQDAINNTGENLQLGDVVLISWNNEAGKVQLDSKGQKAIGNVQEGGSIITIVSPGDTNLGGEVSISGEYGENQGWGGASEVSCSNVGGQASFLSE